MSSTEQSVFIETIRQFINDHPREPLSIETLAAVVQLPMSRLLIELRAKTGLLPHAFIRQVRLERAAREILLTDKRIWHIARDCGLGNLSDFIKLFKNQFGTTPREWRVVNRKCHSMDAIRKQHASK